MFSMKVSAKWLNNVVVLTTWFFIVPVDSNMSRAEGLNTIFEKSEDLKETTESHLACRCSAQCA